MSKIEAPQDFSGMDQFVAEHGRGMDREQEGMHECPRD